MINFDAAFRAMGAALLPRTGIGVAADIPCSSITFVDLPSSLITLVAGLNIAKIIAGSTGADVNPLSFLGKDYSVGVPDNPISVPDNPVTGFPLACRPAR